MSIALPPTGKFPRPKALPPVDIIDAIKEYAAVCGVPLEFGLAMAFHESSFDPKACATNPADLARGGSYGLFQMSLKTARRLVPKVPLEPAMLYDVNLNCELWSDLVMENRKIIAATAEVDRDKNLFIDLAALHNSGKVFAKAPLKTRYNYVPAVAVAMQVFQKLLKGGAK